MREEKDARALAKMLLQVSKALGKSACAFLTSMDQPLGRAVGNALEIVESLEILRDAGPPDVRELVLELGVEMVLLAGIESNRAAARERLESKLRSGEAFAAFRSWVAAQSGDPSVVDEPSRLPRAKVVLVLESPTRGFLAAFDTREFGLAANALGAGRTRLGAKIDASVGFVFRKKLGEKVEVGEPLVEIHARTKEAAGEASRRVLSAISFADKPRELRPLIRDSIRA
jgi:thymidine phosphorylase